MNTKKLIQKYKSQGYSGVKSKTLNEGGTKVDLVLADAKKGTPVGRQSYHGSTASKRKVHIATYVPSSKKTFHLSTRYAKKASTPPRQKPKARRKVRVRNPFQWGLF